MSVRLTERIVGEIVVVKGLPKSPQMVVQAIDLENNMVITTWFSDGNGCEEGAFPPKALEKAEPKQAAKPKAASRPKAKK